MPDCNEEYKVKVDKEVIEELEELKHDIVDDRTVLDNRLRKLKETVDDRVDVLYERLEKILSNLEIIYPSNEQND